MFDLHKNYNLMNGADLAYLGDAYWELLVREHLLSKGITKSNELKKQSVLLVSACAHQLIFDKLCDCFTEEEINIFKRGRNNAPHNKRKNLDYAKYCTSTGFEAVIGYLYLKADFERINEFFEQAVEIIEGEINE